MVFHSVSFGVFLVFTLTLFWLTARRRSVREAILLAASYFFYGSWHPWYLSLIIGSTLLDYVCGKVIAGTDDPRKKKLALVASLTGNLGLLCFFKLWDWVAGGMVDLFGVVGLESPVHPLGLIIPVGISFYTFQTLSYTIDVYRGNLAPARSLLDFALFVAFFPQLVAGPIVRAVEFLPQLELTPRFDAARLKDGLFRIAQGLTKKVLLADVIGRYLVDPIYNDPSAYTAPLHALALYAFVFQIYFDFAGYSDCAIGAARLFGFDLPENFDLPYRSRSPREFWRRWHITLSTWIRDYIYFPLGGSRGTELRTLGNLMFVMLIMGLWHGSSWRWIVFGLVHGVALASDRWLLRRRGGEDYATTPARSLLTWLLTFHFLVLSMVTVRATSLEHVGRMFTDFGAGTQLARWGLIALGLGALTHFLPPAQLRRLQERYVALPVPVVALGVGVVVGCVAIVVVGATPFIYFQF